MGRVGRACADFFSGHLPDSIGRANEARHNQNQPHRTSQEKLKPTNFLLCLSTIKVGDHYLPSQEPLDQRSHGDNSPGIKSQLKPRRLHFWSHIRAITYILLAELRARSKVDRRMFGGTPKAVFIMQIQSMET